MSFSKAVVDLLQHPFRIIALWNWKAALLSILLRGPIFVIATIRRGWETSLETLLTEAVVCMLTAGFYGAIVQVLRNAEPEWLTILFVTLVLPAIFQVVEYSFHWLRGTPHLRLVELASVAVSALSALFNWYAMRRGTLLVGGEGGSFGADLRRLPRLIVDFLAALPRRMAKGDS